MFNSRRGHQRTEGFAIILLISQMARVGFDRIPPVTLLAIAGQVALYMKLITIPYRTTIDSTCISALHVWYRDDWARLVLSAFYHADEWHLYYNMISMLWKGQKLERKFGSLYFLGILSIFTVLVNAVLLGLSFVAESMLQDSSYITQCHVGFSGVLFAFKVLVNYMEPETMQYVMGIIPFPSRIVCWAELVLIHILIPNSSFLGHLAGIIVGIWFVKGPLLRRLIDYALSPFSGTFTQAPYGQNRFYSGSGESGYHHTGTPAQQPLSAEDIRNRRLNRLDNLG